MKDEKKIMCIVPQKVNEYDQEMPQLHREEKTQSTKATQQQEDN